MTEAEMFPSSYLGKDDVPAPFRATIVSIQMQPIRGDHGTSDKPVVYFQGAVKPMIMNQANWNTLKMAFGTNSVQSHGREVEIYVDPSVMFGRDRVGGVRLRIPLVSDGQPLTPVATWDLEQAVTECEKVGITRQQLIDPLKAQGFMGWKPSRDTGYAKRLIAAAEAVQDIPF